MTIKIKVILGTTRQNRFGDKPAQWICDEARAQSDVDIRIAKVWLEDSELGGVQLPDER